MYPFGSELAEPFSVTVAPEVTLWSEPAFAVGVTGLGRPRAVVDLDFGEADVLVVLLTLVMLSWRVVVVTGLKVTV